MAFAVLVGKGKALLNREILDAGFPVFVNDKGGAFVGVVNAD